MIWYKQFLFLIIFYIPISSCTQKELLPGALAPELINTSWLQSPKLKLSELKGKVVLIRWWTDECMFCINSADALNEWYTMYSDSGLVIIGMYHPKPEPKICAVEDVREYALDKEFRFPIAIDDQWLNLKKYWLDAKPRNFTSVSFLIDQKGVIRYIHPGGEYHKEMEEGHEQCVADYLALQNMIRTCIRSK
jgi:peroxiredoxin